MSQAKHAKQPPQTTPEKRGREELCTSPMMTHLLDALEQGIDIGHYGRLTFVIVARHFLDEDELVSLLSQQPDHDAEDARVLVRQVQAHDYNPPKRERILEWQAQQDFPICPTPNEPGTCNVYQELQFPEGIYEHISEFYEEQIKAEENQASNHS
jgi:DNA primase large subunit